MDDIARWRMKACGVRLAELYIDEFSGALASYRVGFGFLHEKAEIIVCPPFAFGHYRVDVAHGAGGYRSLCAAPGGHHAMNRALAEYLRRGRRLWLPQYGTVSICNESGSCRRKMVECGNFGAAVPGKPGVVRDVGHHQHDHRRTGVSFGDFVLSFHHNLAGPIACLTHLDVLIGNGAISKHLSNMHKLGCLVWLVHNEGIRGDDNSWSVVGGWWCVNFYLRGRDDGGKRQENRERNAGPGHGSERTTGHEHNL